MSSDTPTINEYLAKLNDELRDEKDNFFYAYRGQPSENFLLDCSAARNFVPEVKEDKVFLKESQVKLVSDFRMKGFGVSKDKNRRLYDLELLGDLRHYGAPSCLLDFTSDFLIALWFACEDSNKEYTDKNGKIFILNCYETDRFSVVSSKNIKKKIGKFFDDRFQKIWYWVPERLNQRLTDQDAIFIFGKSEIKEYKSITVLKGDKPQVLDELEKFFDYSRKTLFSDRYAIGEIYKDFANYKKQPEDCLEEAVYYIQTGNFSKVKSLLEIIIRREDLFHSENTKNLFLEARFQRAYSEIERIKKESRGDPTKIAKHFEKISSRKASYTEDFQFCIENGYKQKKIQSITEEFKFNFSPDPK